jgi:cell division protein FtsN
MLAGVFIGLLIGLCLALAVALYLNRYNPFAARSTPADKPEPRVESPKAAPPVGMPTAARPRAQAARQADAKRFDFYKILPGTEEAVSEKDLKSRQAPGAAARDVYYLQAGAFQSSSDADNLKARLALAGLEAQIQTATLPDRTVWHRVRVGPYKDPDAMVQARSVLRENKIEPSIIKVAERDTR